MNMSFDFFCQPSRLKVDCRVKFIRFTVVLHPSPLFTSSSRPSRDSHGLLLCHRIFGRLALTTSSCSESSLAVVLILAAAI
ncbi:hypothetical protein F2Q69_00016461 [Brassica cretica]|uniref:Uncharacterized protein n=1 Tax=Brassica cretica TaxID=69181 RepID=A0A8S9QVE7_BRACR|nr:hypothetical protein F2Q69_00016461 [Brassica cretica]